MHPLQHLPIYELGKIFDEEPDETLAKKIIREFYKVYDAEAAHDEAWAITTIVMQADNEHVDQRERSNALYFFEYFNILNAAVAYLNSQNNEQYDDGADNETVDEDDDNE